MVVGWTLKFVQSFPVVSASDGYLAGQLLECVQSYKYLGVRSMWFRIIWYRGAIINFTCGIQLTECM